MPPTRSSKKQTRLAFTPLPSSSPQSASLPSHLQTRAASVRYDDSASPTKRRRVSDIAATPKITTVSSPSRLAGSIQDSDVVHGSEEDRIMQSPFKRPWSSNKTRSLKRINRGLATPDPSSQLHLDEPGRQSTNSETQILPLLTDDPDSDSESIASDTESDVILPKARLAQPSTPRSKLRKVSKTQFKARTNSINEDEEDLALPKHATRSQARKAVVLSSDEDADEEAVTLSSPYQRHQHSRGAGESPPTAGQSRRPLSSPVDPRSLPSGGYTGSTSRTSSRRHIDLTPTRPRNHQRALRTSRTSSDKDQTRERSSRTKSARIHHQEESLDSASSLPDVATLLTPRAARKQAADVTSDDESDIVVTNYRSSRASRPRPRALSFAQETEESEDVVATPSKRKRLTSHTEQSGSRNIPRKQDDEDLEEDLEVLQDTGKRQALCLKLAHSDHLFPELRTDRTRGKSAPSKRSAALEKLKARRVGHKVIDLSSDSEAPTQPRRALYDHDSIGEAESQDSADRDKDEDEDEEWRNEAIRQSLRDEEGEYDKDFVVDDDEETLGAPDILEGIPLEFTRHAHKKTKEHFKDVVEWMVHKKLNPAFPRDDGVYQVAFYKLDDEVSGYAGSKFLSAAWTGDFARAIKARPRYSDVPVPVEMFTDLHHCEACNRTNHPAKFIITFDGKPYYKETLENVSEDDEDEENDSDDHDGGSRNADGFVLPSVDRQYYVGRSVVDFPQAHHSCLL